MGRTIEKNEVRKSAEADARAEWIGRRNERDRERHEPTNFFFVPRNALFPDGRLCDTAIMWKRLAE